MEGRSISVIQCSVAIFRRLKAFFFLKDLGKVARILIANVEADVKDRFRRLF